MVSARYAAGLLGVGVVGVALGAGVAVASADPSGGYARDVLCAAVREALDDPEASESRSPGNTAELEQMRDRAGCTEVGK